VSTTGIAKTKPDSSRVKTREPWPKSGLYTGQGIDDYTWGYLYMNDAHEFYFDETETPSVEEIEARWGFWINRDQAGRE